MNFRKELRLKYGNKGNKRLSPDDKNYEILLELSIRLKEFYGNK
jgi:hypothetical protein